MKPSRPAHPAQLIPPWEKSERAELDGRGWGSHRLQRHGTLFLPLERMLLDFFACLCSISRNFVHFIPFWGKDLLLILSFAIPGISRRWVDICIEIFYKFPYKL